MNHIAIVDENLEVWTWGNNSSGQLGLGDFDDRQSPVKILGLPPIISTTLGPNFTVFLDYEGYVWISGLHSEKINNNPVRIEGLENITKIASGLIYVLLLDNKGKVFTLNINPRVNLGPRLNNIKNIPKIKDVFCGKMHSCMIDFDGNVFSFGSNGRGQLGVGDENDRVAPTKIDNLPPIRSAALDGGHTFLVDINNEIYSCGCNFEGQLGLGDMFDRNIPTKIEGLPKIKSVWCLGYYIVLIDVDDKIWSLGYPIYGDTDDTTIPKMLDLDIRAIDSIISFSNLTIIVNIDCEIFTLCENDEGYNNFISLKLDFKPKVSGHSRFKTTKNARN